MLLKNQTGSKNSVEYVTSACSVVSLRQLLKLNLRNLQDLTFTKVGLLHNFENETLSLKEALGSEVLQALTYASARYRSECRSADTNLQKVDEKVNENRKLNDLLMGVPVFDVTIDITIRENFPKAKPVVKNEIIHAGLTLIFFVI
uniref:Uncharacterized protein n=1 Tax=Parascaris univalens TaxID=6257 RepID=A0A914ZSS1_PARUN